MCQWDNYYCQTEAGQTTHHHNDRTGRSLLRDRVAALFGTLKNGGLHTLITAALVEELRSWSDGIFARTHVRYEIRYQGRDLFVYTERGWSAMAPEQRQRGLRRRAALP